MSRKIDWDKYTFRASQAHKLLVGTIGLTDKEKEERAGLLSRKMANARGENDENGKPVKPLTQNMEDRLALLNEKEKDKTLPKTMTNELRKIHRMETYNRNFNISTKYIRKGLSQEEEAITNYQMYLNKTGKRVLLTKNTERLYNDFFEGEPDIWRKGDKIGYDTKCSWSLDTFPFPSDELIIDYESQNQVYMNLTGAEEWVTAYCLVNIHEHGLNNEKLKEYYVLDCPDEEHENYYEYRKRCMDIERMLIFDYERFTHAFPYHDLFYTKEQWMDEGNDIPLEERIIEKKSYRNDDFIKELKERRLIAIEYLKSLN
jgi:hypothetical protein